MLPITFEGVAIVLESIAHVLDSFAKLHSAVAATQTPAQQKELLDRWLEFSRPGHRISVRLVEQMEKLLIGAVTEAKPVVTGGVTK